MSVQALAEQLPLALTALALSTPRLLVFMALVTLFPPLVFPRLLRMGIAIGLAAPVAFGVFHGLAGQAPTAGVAVLVAKECAIGFALGAAAAGPFWALQSVGALIDQQRGANAAGVLTPFAQSEASLISAALTQAFVVALASSGMLALLYLLLLQSFHAWPVLQVAPDLAAHGFALAAQRLDHWMATAVLWAAPILVIILLVDFAFALVTLFAPQMQAYFAAMPVKSLAAIAVLAVYASVLLAHADAGLRNLLHRESAVMPRPP